jgi:hypothetical protein
MSGLSIAFKVAKDNSFMQYAKATNRSAECDFLSYTLNINATVNRASHGQLIEGGPPPLLASQNFPRKSGRNILRVCNPSLGTQLLAALKINGQLLDFQNMKDQEAFDTPQSTFVDGKLCIQSG